MADQKISDLSTATPADTDSIPAARAGGSNVRFLWSAIKAALQTVFDARYGSASAVAAAQNSADAAGAAAASAASAASSAASAAAAAQTTANAAAPKGAIISSGLTQATARLLGRTTAGTGAPEEISVGSGLILSGGVLSSDGVPVPIASSRSLTSADDGKVLECTAASITLTVPAGLPQGWACIVIPNGTTSIASSGGALLNGAITTLTRAAASNPMFAIQGRASAVDSYVVTGD